jgi:dTDP-4-amino-4,6-dideoxygalactose transaminase
MGEPELPVFDVRVEPEEMEAVAATLRSGWLSAGPQTEAFESEFAWR